MFEPSPLSPSRHTPRNWHGKITEIDNYGTVVQVLLLTDAGRLVPVNFDHRMFGHMVHARGADRIVGYAVTFDGGGATPCVRFDDSDEPPVRSGAHGDEGVS